MTNRNIAILPRLILLLVAGFDLSASAASGLFLKTPAAANAYVVNFSGDTSDSQATAYALQGLVNNASAQVYINSRGNDINHLNDCGKPYTVLSQVGGTYSGLLTLFQKYQTNVSKLFIYDPTKDWTFYLAVMAGAQSNGIPVTAAIAVALQAQFPGWTGSVVDYSNLGTNRVQAYDWALTNLMPNCTRKSLFVITSPYKNVIDYVVSSKSFVFNLDVYTDASQSNECVKIFATPGYGPGTSLGGYDGDSINIVANPYGIGYCVSDFYSNGSFWSSFPNNTYTQRAGSAVTAQSGKVYVSIVLSDGDNLQIDQELLYNIWKDPARGSVPVGTGLSPVLQEINSPLLDYFYANKTTNDELIAGPNGFQFTYLNNYNATFLPQWCITNTQWCADAGFHTASVWIGTYPNANYNTYTANCGLECVRHHYNGIANPQFTNGVVILNECINDCTNAIQLYNDLAGVNTNASVPVFTTDKLIAPDFNNTNFSAVKSVIDQLNANFPGKYIFQLPSDQAETAWNYYAAATPTFSLPAGNYYGTQSVTISSTTAGATIFYTTNGTTPTTSSPSSTNGFTILMAPPVNMTIKAFARLVGKVNSRIASANYTVVAAPATWTNSAGGSWVTAANWSNSIIANGIGTTADFSKLTLASNLTVTLNGARTNGNLIFDDQNLTNHIWTLVTGSAGPLTLATVNGAPIVSNNLDVNLNVVLAGTQGLQKSGAGTLTLTNANTYTGSTIISGGTLMIGGAGRLGSGTYAAAITNNGNFTYNSSASQTLSGIISGTGDLSYLGNGTLTLSGTNTYFGSTTVSNGTLVLSGTGSLYSAAIIGSPVLLSVGSGAQINISSTANNAVGQGTNESWSVAGTINSTGAASHTLPSSVTLNNGTLTGNANAAFGTFFNSSANAATITANGANNTISAANIGTTATLIFSTPLAADVLSVSSAIGIAAKLTGGVTKTGLGTVTLTGTNLYNGSTMINAGTLALTGGGSITDSASITVAGGAILNVSGLTSAFILAQSLTGQAMGNSATGAIINGTNNCSTGTLSLVYDGANPCFIQTNGGMRLSAATILTVNNLGIPLASGTYTLIAATVTGSLGKVFGSVPTVTVTGNGATGAASLAIDGSGNLNLVIGSSQAWAGTSDANWTTPGNWTTGVIPIAGSNVIFNASSTANLATVLNANFNLGMIWVTTPTGPVSIDGNGGVNSLTISNGINMAFASQPLTIIAPMILGANQIWMVTNGRTLTVNGNISGSAALTISGGGTVAMGGTNTVSSVTVANNAVINQLPSGLISGSGVTFTHNSTGTSTLAGKNTYTGVTTVSAGTLNLSGQDTGSSVIVTNNAAFNATGVIAGPGITFTHNSSGSSTLAGKNTYTGTTTINGGSLTITGAGQLGSGSYATNIINNGAFNYNSSANQIISGTITGVGVLNYLGNGTLTLSGANTYTGNTTVTNGTLAVAGSGYLYGSGNPAADTSVTVASGAQIILSGSVNNGLGSGPNENWIVSGTINSSGGAAQTLPTGDIFLTNGILTGTYNSSFGTFYCSGAPTITANGNNNVVSSADTRSTIGFANSSSILTLTTPLATDALNVTTPIGFAGRLSGGLIKSGLGTVTLTAASPYTGSTIINSGTLFVNNSTGSGTGTASVTINSGGTLGGTGTILSSVTNNTGGTISAGVGVGTLSTGSQIWNGGGTNRFELSSATNSAGRDLLNISGTLNVQATMGNKFIVKLVSMVATNTPGLLPDFNPNTSYTWVMASASGGILNFDASMFAIDASAFANSYSGTFAVTNIGNNLAVIYTALIPPILSGFVQLNSTSFQLTFSGSSGQTYQVLRSTNLALPLSSWTTQSSGTFGPIPVIYTNTNSTNQQQFYRIQSP